MFSVRGASRAVMDDKINTKPRLYPTHCLVRSPTHFGRVEHESADPTRTKFLQLGDGKTCSRYFQIYRLFGRPIQLTEKNEKDVK